MKQWVQAMPSCLFECDPLNSKYGIDMTLYNTRHSAAVARSALSAGSWKLTARLQTMQARRFSESVHTTSG